MYKLLRLRTLSLCINLWLPCVPLFGNDVQGYPVDATSIRLESGLFPPLDAAYARRSTVLALPFLPLFLLLLFDPESGHLIPTVLVRIIIFVSIAVQARKAVLIVKGFIVGNFDAFVQRQGPHGKVAAEGTGGTRSPVVASIMNRSMVTAMVTILLEGFPKGRRKRRIQGCVWFLARR